MQEVSTVLITRASADLEDKVKEELAIADPENPGTTIASILEESKKQNDDTSQHDRGGSTENNR